MFKKILLTVVISTTVLISLFPHHSNAVIYEDTDWLNCWKTTRTGYIYSPVALTAKVIIDYSYLPSSNELKVTRKDLIATALASYWSVYPNATLELGNLNLRYTNQSLPYSGSYYSDPNYATIGRYSATTQYFGTTPSSGYGETLFYVQSSGYQTNNTARVDFNF